MEYDKRLDKREVISTNQHVWMLFSIIVSFTALQIPGLLILHVGRDAWISVIIAWFLDVMLAIIYAYMGLRFSGQSFVQYSITILGKYLGVIIGAMFPLFYIMVASVLMRAMGIFISNMIMPLTPMEVVLATGYALIAYAVKKGIEVIARVCELLGPVYLISFILLFVLIIPQVRIRRLEPVLYENLYPVLSGAILILTFIGICIMMTMYIPISNKPEDGFKAKFIAVTLGASAISMLVFLSVGIFGAKQAGSMVNPGLQLARMVSIADIIDRIEIIWFIIAIGAGLMTCSNLIWAFCYGISQIFNLSTYNPIVVPAVLIAFVLSIISFDSNIEVINFIFYSYPFIGLFVETGLEVFMFLTAIILKKRG